MSHIHIVDPVTDSTVIVDKTVLNQVKSYMTKHNRDSAYINVEGRRLIAERTNIEVYTQ